jgi:UDP-N-acetylmuramoyl-tripeptide--D-alanyl-D-alanine ligase
MHDGKSLGACKIENLQTLATETRFDLTIGEERIALSTKLLGAHNAENIALAAALAKEMGLTATEIADGIRELSFVPHRLELIENGGVYILDDGYNANERGAKQAIEALCRFEGKKWIVTPGIVECGVLEETINGTLGAEIATAGIDRVILVGETLVGAVKSGYLSAGGDMAKLTAVNTLDKAQAILAKELAKGDCVLFLNDLPDVF